jgi:biopolymer transport protein ExbD
MAFQPSKRKEKALSSLVEETDLDVTPIMNILVILIPFLVSMAVFTQIAAISFSLPPAATEDEEPEEEKKKDNATLDISIAITDKGFTITGTRQVLPLIPKRNGKYNLPALNKVLREIKMRYPRQEDIVLIIEGDVFYEDIVAVMDLCRDAHFPNIGMSGGIQ